MDIKQGLELKQQQRLILTPKLQQAMHILHLPIMELKTLLQQEIAQNPLLQEGGDEKENNEALLEEAVKLDSKWDEYFQATRPAKYTRVQREKRDFAETSVTKLLSLQHHLLGQLDELTLKKKEREIAEIIIVNINDDGYLMVSGEEIAHLLKITSKRVEKVLSVIQNFDPPGIGARNLAECLLLQLKSKKVSDQVVDEIVNNHLNDLAKKNFEKIASVLGVKEDIVEEKAKLIADLDPKPGRKYSSYQANFIIPDVLVKKIEGDYTVVVNERDLPPLRINSLYKKLIKKGRNKDTASKYAKEKLNDALWLMKNIQSRQDTVYRVASYIVEKQKEFLERGAGYLKPLTLKEVAGKLGLHQSTISRVTSNKYMETPRGIFKLKYFFSGSLLREEKNISSKNVQELIRSLINNGNPPSALSDQKIADILKEKGYKIARRTVAKYREQMGILPSKLRGS